MNAPTLHHDGSGLVQPIRQQPDAAPTLAQDEPQDTNWVNIQVEWHIFNYGRRENDPVFVLENTVIEKARICPRSYIVNYGDGRVRKVLKRFRRHHETPRSSWREYYGTHERCSRTLLIFKLLPTTPTAAAPEPIET